MRDLPPGREGRRITWIGAGVNAGLMVLKFLAGYYGRSQAMIADAVHTLSDLFTDGVVLFGLAAGRKEADSGHQFGHARIETLASAVVGLSLLVVAGYLGLKSGLDIYHHNEVKPTWLALTGAALSLVTKEILFRYTVLVGRRIKSPAVVANAWHHRSDAMSSVAVFLGLLGAQINPGWHILDAYAALLVAVFIAKVGLGVLLDAVREMTDSAPAPAEVSRIEACIRTVPGVLDHHDLKIRSMGGLFHIQVHVLVGDDLTVIQGHKIATAVEACLKAEIDNAGQVIVHIDPLGRKKVAG